MAVQSGTGLKQFTASPAFLEREPERVGVQSELSHSQDDEDFDSDHQESEERVPRSGDQEGHAAEGDR